MKVLPEAVRDTLARGWTEAPLNFLGGGEDWSDGTVFTAPGPKADLVIKILDFSLEDVQAVDRAEERVRFVRFFGDHGCRIVMPRPNRQGDLFQVTETEARRYLAYAYDKVPGRPVNKDDPEVKTGWFFEAVGRELGRMHAIWQSRGDVVHPDGTGVESQALRGWREEMAFFRTWCQDERVAGAWDRVRTALEVWPVEASSYGFVHNDAHVWNFLVDPDAPAASSPTLIDFDVANYHWYVCDCAVALYSFGMLDTGGIETAHGPDPDFMKRATDRFWKGYSEHRPVPSSGIELFLQYRRCLLFMPFQEQTAQNPAWREHWVRRILEADQRLFG